MKFLEVSSQLMIVVSLNRNLFVQLQTFLAQYVV